jgi:putative nucleotidyltransferase with HDIG domain
MSERPVLFLHSMAHALSAMQLYGEGHPARARVVDRSFEKLRELLDEEAPATFSFIDGSVIYGHRTLHDMHEWPWAERLGAQGAQRMEFANDVIRDAFGHFLDDLFKRVSSEANADGPLPARPGITCGMLRVTGEGDLEMSEEFLRTATLPYRLGEETEAVRWLYQRAALQETVPLDEVEAVVRSLAVAVRSEGEILIPLLELQSHDDYSTMHAINVAVLAMTLAESLGMGSKDIRAFGTAGLLHDIGMSRVPEKVLKKQKLTQADRQVVQQHPEEGARLLLRRDAEFELAAIAAYEHHGRPDGHGYPGLRYSRDFHYVSKVISVCDAYDALRTPRSYRPAWEPAEALRYIEQGAGSIFDAGVASTFVSFLRRMDGQVVLIGPDGLVLARDQEQGGTSPNGAGSDVELPESPASA